MTQTQDHYSIDSIEYKLLDAIRRNPTMEDVAKLREPTVKTPEAAIEALKRGNARFFGNEATRPELSANERRAQIMSQTPFAVVLGCSDSRVPVEVVFDQGLGELFAVRVAGNIADTATLGSIEYAICHLKCQLVVVMGHEGCGAVKAAMLDEASLEGEPAHVQHIISNIRPAVQNLPAIRDAKARMREAVINNVRLQVHQLKQNVVIQGAVERGQIEVIGAFYEIGSGAVDFLVSDEDLKL